MLTLFRSIRPALLVVLGTCIVLSFALVSAATATYTGSLSGLGDEDFYTIELEAGETLTATMRNIDPGCEPFDPYLMLHPADDLTDILAEDDDSADGCGMGLDSRLVYTAKNTGSYVLRVTSYDTIYEVVDAEGFAEGTYRLTIQIGSPSNTAEWFNPGDNRINIDAHAPVTIYCTDANGVAVYTVNGQGVGVLAFAVSGADIAAAAPGTQVASGGGATLFKLADGTLQVNATQPDGKGYMFIWNGCPVRWANSYIVVNGAPTLTNARRW